MKRRSQAMYVLERQEEDDVISAQLCAFLCPLSLMGYGKRMLEKSIQYN